MRSGWTVVRIWGLCVDTMNWVFRNVRIRSPRILCCHCGLQVQLDFIDQGDRLGFEGIRKVWIALCHAPGQIGGKREHGLIAAA